MIDKETFNKCHLKDLKINVELRKKDKRKSYISVFRFHMKSTI